MAIVTYAAYVPDVAVYASGCPSPVILDAMRKTAIDFFHESGAYRVWLAAFDLTISTSTYTLTGEPAETEICQILQVNCDGVPVDEKRHEEFLALDREWPSKTGANAQYYTVLGALPDFDIIPIPDATVADAFTVQVAVHPTLTSTGVEAAYFEPWKDGIVDGTLARVLRIPNRVWTDRKEAMEREKSYLMERTKARIAASKGNIARDVMVQMRRWV